MCTLLTYVLLCLAAHFGFLVCIRNGRGPSTGGDDLADSIPVVKAMEHGSLEDRPSNPVGFFDACVLNIKDWLDTSNQEFETGSPCEDAEVSVVYRKCALHYHVDLETQVRSREMVSGKDVIDAFSNFCAKRDDVHNCVKEYLDNHNCSDADVERYRDTLAVGEYYCNGNWTRPFIYEMYQHLPPVGTRASTDECMKKAYSRYNACLMPQLLAAILHTRRDVTDVGWKLDNMVCVLRGFGGNNGCPVREAFLTTTILHSQLLVPPAYGINVTKYVLEMDNHVRQRASTKGKP